MKVVYIVSSPHGGSTLLSLVLGLHPEAANLGEVSFIPKLLALREPCTCGTAVIDCKRWAQIFNGLVDGGAPDLRRYPYDFHLGDAIKGKSGSGLVDQNFQTAARKIGAKLRGALNTAALLYAPGPRALRTLTPPSVRAGVHNTFKLYSTASETWSRRLVIDASKMPKKAPDLYVHYPEQIRIVHLIRDGRAVAASRKKYMSVRESSRRWAHYHRLTSRILNRWVAPEHRRCLRYEDFVADPERHVRDLCGWLGFDYSTSMLDLGQTRTLHSAGGNPARFQVSGGIRPADERWKTVLSEKDIEIFRSEAAAVNGAFGYG